MKKSLMLLCSVMSMTLMSGCEGESERTPEHVHSFDEEHWESDEINHWHKTTCGHNEFTKDLAKHVFGDNNICDTCGYIKQAPVDKYFEFTFIGYHCFANNQTSYKENSQVNITFTIENGYHLPDSINVVGTNTFTYNKQEKSLSLIMDSDITVVVNAIEDEKPEPTMYLVSFDSCGGTSIDPISVEENQAFIRPNDPSKENQVFMGWYQTSDYSGNEYVFGTRVTSDIKLYALWGVEVSFINYDGSLVSKQTIRAGCKLEQPQNPEYLNTHFEGWYLNEERSGDKFNFDTTLEKNIRLYAQYYYKATFFNADETEFKTEKVLLGDKLIKPSNPSLEYHDFFSWYLDKDLTEEFDFDNELDSDIVLYSKFTPKKYNIYYNNAEGFVHSNPETYVYGVGISELFAPSLDQYDNEFYGWYLDPEFTTPVTSISEEAYGDINLYAKRAEKYDILYINWPINIPNPNPKTYTIYDEVLIDISNIIDSKIYANPSFLVNGDNVPGISKGTKGEVRVLITYYISQTTITLDPNKGDLLPENTSIYIDFGIEEYRNVKVDVANIKKAIATNIYDPNVVTIPEKSGYIFRGFSLSPLASFPLSEEEVNELENGYKIYAVWETKNGAIGPEFNRTVLNGESLSQKVLIPNNIKKIKLNFNCTKISGGLFEIDGYFDKKINRLS